MGDDLENNHTNSENENPVDEEAMLIEALEQSVEEINLSIDFMDVAILDDEDAKRKDIEALKDKLSPTIVTRLFSLGNSNHFARISSGKITQFADIVIHLGTEYTKVTAIFIAFSELAVTEQMKLVIAKCFATSKLAEIIAYQMKLPVQDRNMVILSGLFIEIGKLIILLHAENEDIELNEDFIHENHPYIGTKVIEKFELPSPLKEIIDHPHFTFIKKNSLALSAVIDLAYSVINESFANHGKLIIQSTMPDPEGVIYNATVGSMLISQFQSIGLGKYLHVVPTEFTEQEQRLIEKSK